MPKTAQPLIPTMTVDRDLLNGLEGERYQLAEAASRYAEHLTKAGALIAAALDLMDAAETVEEGQ